MRVTLSATTLRTIANAGDMSLNIERDSFDKWLNIINSSTLFINADNISADDKIELVNHGTADEVNITSMGQATIRTSELNM